MSEIIALLQRRLTQLDKIREEVDRMTPAEVEAAVYEGQAREAQRRAEVAAQKRELRKAATRKRNEQRRTAERLDSRLTEARRARQRDAYRRRKEQIDRAKGIPIKPHRSILESGGDVPPLPPKRRS